MRYAALLCVLLSACSMRVATGAGAAPSAPPASPPPPPAVSAERPDTCGRTALVSYIGKSKDLLPAKPAGAAWRVTCTTCPVTQDYSPARLNILFDEKTGVVKEVKCG